MNNCNSTNRLVCFFDSGIGGLTLLNECSRRRRDINFAYFADNYNMPYGNLTHEKMLSLVDGKFEVISRLNPMAAVVACNTVTAECIFFLRQKYTFPIIGIQPAVKPAALKYKNCIVLSTPATARSQAVIKLIKQYGRGHTRIIPCQNLAAYIENNIFNMKREYIVELLPKEECDCVVLGCTHYSYASDIISEFYGCPVLDGIEGTANQFEKVIGDCENNKGNCSEVSFFGGDYVKNCTVFSYLRGIN